MAGELEEWHPSDILMPDPLAYRQTYERLLGLVNGLLVAYLIRRVTGDQWPRALTGFPDWREGKFFSMSVRLSPATPDTEVDEKPKADSSMDYNPFSQKQDFQ